MINNSKAATLNSITKAILILILIFSGIRSEIFAQQRIVINLAKEQANAIASYEQLGVLHYSHSGQSGIYDQIPCVALSISTGEQSISQAKIVNIYYSTQEIVINTDRKSDNGPALSVQQSKARGVNYSTLSFLPGRLLPQGRFRLIDSIEIEYRLTDALTIRNNPPIFKTESVLQAGDFYKISTTNSGIFKITNEDLKNLGVDINNIQVNMIQLFGTLPGALPELNSDPRTDDLEEMAVYIKGGDDGKWDSNDEIWFYSPGPDAWQQNADSTWYRITNIYDDHKYFFLRVNAAPGRRVSQAYSPVNYDISTSEYLDVYHWEEDRYNILKSEKDIGGGKLWFGDLFYKTFRSKDYTSAININNLIPGKKINVSVAFAGRSSINTILNVKVGSQSFPMNLSRVNLGGENTAADYKKLTFSTTALDATLNFILDYPEAGGVESKGWLDYFTINSIRSLDKTNGKQLIFRPETGLNGNLQFVIRGISQISTIWDISDMFNVGQFAFSVNGDKAMFNIDQKVSTKLIAFDPQDIQSVALAGKVAAQNLHAAATPDLLVVYNDAFREQALDFANYRSQKSGIVVLAVEVNQVYNEFSGGAQDPTAIRDLARMFYSRQPDKIKNLLLFGNGSFDYRDIGVKNKDYSVNTNFIPVYEQESTKLHPIGTFPMDDYFTYLDPEESVSGSKMDIGVGRFPVNTASEAATIVAKIKTYETSSESRGDWRNSILLIADDYDETSDDFQDQSERLADRVSTWDDVVNVKKIFADLYKQENLIQGERYPDVVKDINDAINKGVLIANYIGHGGTTKLADEELIDRQAVNSWNNQNKLPLFITGTCSFSVYDDPTVNALGRDCIIRPNGGMVGLITTTRSVYISPNEWIVNKLFEYLINKVNGLHRDLGEVLYQTKNAHGQDDSKRFVLLGDPSMQLAFPKNSMNITSINGKSISDNEQDTIGALEKVNIQGNVADENNAVLSGFNGTATITVFDKQVVLLTRGNDGNGTNTPITVRNNVIFHGKASVKSGLWQVDFVVPKDINYLVDSGKISTYAENGVNDASGYSYRFLVGGESSNPVIDNQAPQITLALDDYNFQNGSTVTTTPLLLAKIEDDNGINITGNSIGHDIVSTVKSVSTQETILNDYFTADQDNSKAGEVQYQLQTLTPGNYTLQLRAWDIANNKSEAQIDFVVSEDVSQSIDHVLNYPNPFTTATSFMFEYDSHNQPIEAQIAIYTVSGKLVKTITEQLSPIGKRFKSSVWNGKDDFDGQLAKGVYLYKVKVLGSDRSKGKRVISDFQKMVLLK